MCGGGGNLSGQDIGNWGGGRNSGGGWLGSGFNGIGYNPYSATGGFGGNGGSGGNNNGGGPQPPSPPIPPGTPGGTPTTPTTPAASNPMYWGDLESQWQRYAADTGPAGFGNQSMDAAKAAFMNAGGYGFAPGSLMTGPWLPKTAAAPTTAPGGAPQLPAGLNPAFDYGYRNTGDGYRIRQWDDIKQKNRDKWTMYGG